MPEYGKPIENNLHFKSLVDFFKDEPSDDSEESTPFPMPPVTDAEHPEGAGVPLYDRNGALHPGGFTPDEWVGMLRQSPTSEKGIWNSEWYKNVEPYVAAPRKAPKSDVENSLLKLMKAPVTGDDEAKWNDPRNTPENFPGNEERTNYQGKKFRANELKIPSEEVDVEISEPGPRSFMDRLRGREGEPVTRTETQRQASQRKIELPGARAGLHADFIGGRSKQGGVESYNALGDWRASQGDPNWQKNQIEYYRDNPHLLPTMEEEAASPRRRRFPQQNEPQIYQNSVEKSLLKLMEASADDGGDDTPLPFYHPDNPNHNGTTPGSWPWYKQRGDAKANAVGQGQQQNDILQNQFDRFAAETGTEAPQIPKYKLGQNVTADHHPHPDFKEWHDNDWAQAEEHQPQPTKEDRIEELEHKIRMYSGMRNSRLPLEHPESTRGKYEDPKGPKLSRWTKKDEADHQKEMAEYQAEIERLQGSEDAFKREFPELAVEKALLKLMKGGDAQKLNAMDNPPKENKDSQALVADGDSKRPKSEVGTNEEMFKKAEEENPKYLKNPWEKVKRTLENREANQATQETLPGFESEPPKEEPTPDEVEHKSIESSLLKLMKGHEEFKRADIGMARKNVLDKANGGTMTAVDHEINNPSSEAVGNVGWNPATMASAGADMVADMLTSAPGKLASAAGKGVMGGVKAGAKGVGAATNVATAPVKAASRMKRMFDSNNSTKGTPPMPNTTPEVKPNASKPSTPTTPAQQYYSRGVK